MPALGIPAHLRSPVAGGRWPIEEIHRDAKQLACMDAYQVRSWTALHRHLAQAAMLVYTLAEANESARAAWNAELHLPSSPDQPIPSDLPPVPPSRYEIRARLAVLIAYTPTRPQSAPSPLVALETAPPRPSPMAPPLNPPTTRTRRMTQRETRTALLGKLRPAGPRARAHVTAQLPLAGSQPAVRHRPQLA